MGKYLLILIIIASGLNAKEILDIPFLQEAPEIDGIVSPDEWEKALYWDIFYQVSPGDNTEPSEKTEIFLGHDSENIYILYKLYFKDKARMRSFHCSRDKIYTTDRVFFFFDTFLSNQMAYYIGCNIHGEQADGIILDEIDTTIDLYYVSRGSETDYGFSAELMLPLESIKYESGKDVEWGFFAKRHIPDGPEEISPFPVTRGGGNFYDNYAVIRFSSLPTNRNLRIVPSLTTDYNIYEDKITGEEKQDQEIEPELNIFYEPNSKMSTTMTINPDFNIIEADGLEVEINNRYPRFFQEKRPFFIEQSNPFHTDIIIFNTRNIVDPLAGLKLSGSFEKYKVYVLGALDEAASGLRFGYGEKEKNVPFIFASLSRKAQDGNSFIRTAATLRQFSQYENFVLNFDLNKRFSEEFDLDFQLIASLNETLNNASEIEQDKGFAYASDMEYYNGKWMIYNEFRGFTEDFRADLGYIPETDMNFFNNRIEYQINAQSDRDLIRYMEFASTQNVKLNFDLQDIKAHYWEIMTGAFLNNSFEYWTGFEYQMDHYLGKDFYLHYPWLSVGYEPLRFLKLNFVIVDGINLYYGDEKGEYGDFYKYETTLNLRPLSTLDIELLQKYHETEEKYIARTYEAKVKFQFHKNFWVRGILQVKNNDILTENEEFKDIGFYPLFVYKPSSRSALYLGATSNSQQLEQQGQEEKLVDETETTYFLKLSYTFDIM